jgi:hypothetical protein
MKLKDGFILREVAGETVVLPAGSDLNLNMMISLNDTGKFLWSLLENERDFSDLVSALLAEYDVDEQTAKIAVEGFVAKLNEYEFLTN